LSCVLDTDVLIAAMNRRDAHHRAAAGAVRQLRGGLLLSVVNYAEALVQPAQEEQTLEDALAVIAGLDLELVVPTPSISLDAARFRSLGVSLGDAFAMATALARGATVATFDREVRRALPRAGLQLAPAVR
jgi:predicted nucleic acid-binding protein